MWRQCVFWCIFEPQNSPEKNESKKTWTWVFWDRQSGVHCSCYVLLFTDFVNFGQSHLSGLSLGAFISSTRWIGSCVPVVRKLVSFTETGLIVCHCQYAVRRMVVRSAITATAEIVVQYSGTPISVMWHLLFVAKHVMLLSDLIGFRSAFFNWARSLQTSKWWNGYRRHWTKLQDDEF